MTRLLSGLFAAGLLALCADAQRPPNVVLIISDDHGWSDYGFMGHPHIRTPHLDRLAAQSLVFTRGSVPSSLCRPSLASIMTGLYPHQHRITGNDPPGDARDAANRARMVEVFQESKTIAGLLAARGYVSHQSGKWWEGECRCGGFTECMTHGDLKRGGRHGDDGLKIGRETMQPIFDFIDRAGARPFLVWYAPFLPHTPHNPPERLMARLRARGLPIALARYYAMCEWLDETVGDLLGYLEKKKLAGDTLVVFLADNGWVQMQGDQSLFATRAKMSPYDAGVRTPILVRWPGHIKPRRDETTPVSSVDIAPTVLAAVGIRPDPGMPGIPLNDAVRLARRNAAYGATFVHTSADVREPSSNLKYRWISSGGWKLIVPHSPNAAMPLWERLPDIGWSREPELFHVAVDPREQNNLAAKRADLLRSLSAQLDRWWSPTGAATSR